jgi:hypothetical protein
MVGNAAAPGSRFQFSLAQLFTWMTAVCVVCALALAWVSHLQSIEARDGLIPTGTANLTVFLAFAFATTLLGLTLGPLFCFLLALVHSRRRGPSGEDHPLDS